QMGGGMMGGQMGGGMMGGQMGGGMMAKRQRSGQLTMGFGYTRVNLRTGGKAAPPKTTRSTSSTAPSQPKQTLASLRRSLRLHQTID
ncbi:MAG: hypothetical protein QF406_06965, partial [Verrucomicrobiota bacterium]|nr:hypothetical protein [Verrucomicrobiota bacterium]